MMDIVVIEMKLDLLVNMEENVKLVPVVDISMIVQNLIEIFFLNLREIKVNLKLHQNEKARSILLYAFHHVGDPVLITLNILIHPLALKVFIHLNSLHIFNFHMVIHNHMVIIHHFLIMICHISFKCILHHQCIILFKYILHIKSKTP
ncbi:hypothetical protein Golax_016889 [Gossypium laxum]|uniref:Uncharacterized protein n=1 Tax=Gossypium laxum TaxID=34288 RepID=A0A7J8YYQ6_9ROSI|nr:hypothetical protein [Gossypium laxum]